jgi:hypothetical protein
MDFEELRVIWNSQDDRPLYAINEAGLHEHVRRKSRAFMRRNFWRDFREIAVGLVAGAGFLVFGGMLVLENEDRWRLWLGPDVEVSRWDALTMVVVSGLWLFFASYQLICRKRQEQRERRFESSLRGDIDRTISRTEHQIRMARSIVWWGLLPVWLATLLFVYVIVKLVPTPPTVLLLAAIVIPLGFGIDLLHKRRPLRTELLPLKQEFESLRRKLTEPERRD